jgi:hypothetical protein
MERLFPRALIACIREARPPTPQELASMAEKIWREAFPERPFRHARHDHRRRSAHRRTPDVQGTAGILSR